MNKDKQIRFGTGEILSFEKFFKENFSKFYAFTVRFVEDSYICEDLVQETFISVWESGSNQYDSPIMLHAFIYKTIRNKALNYLKHHKIREQYSQKYLKELESEEYMFSSVLDEEAHYVLYEAIRCLTPQCQTVIKLHLGGKKNKEIALQSIFNKNHSVYPRRQNNIITQVIMKLFQHNFDNYNIASKYK